MRALVLLDTNFLIAAARAEVNLDYILEAVGMSYELATTRSVVNELRAMASRGDKLAREASLALELLNRWGVRVVEASGRADDSLLAEASKAKEEGQAVFVATNDRELRKRLRASGIPSIYVRGNGRVVRAEWNYP